MIDWIPVLLVSIGCRGSRDVTQHKAPIRKLHRPLLSQGFAPDGRRAAPNEFAALGGRPATAPRSGGVRSDLRTQSATESTGSSCHRRPLSRRPDLPPGHATADGRIPDSSNNAARGIRAHRTGRQDAVWRVPRGRLAGRPLDAKCDERTPYRQDAPWIVAEHWHFVTTV